MSRIIGSHFASVTDTDNIETMRNVRLDKELLEAALVGFRQKQSIVEAKIAEIRQKLSHATDGSVTSLASTQDHRSGRKPLSAAARKRIAAAQHKRWAAFRKARKK